MAPALRFGTMADDEKVEDESERPEDPKDPSKKAPQRDTPHVLVRLFLGSAGLLLIIGFFLPWMNFPGDVHRTVSGWQLVTASDTAILAVIGADSQRWLLLLIPGFGVALSGVAVSGIRHSGPIAAMLGILLVGYGIVMVIILFFQRTEPGLWLVLLGAFLAVATGVIAFVRSRGQSDADDGDAKKPAAAAAAATDD